MSERCRLCPFETTEIENVPKEGLKENIWDQVTESGENLYDKFQNFNSLQNIRVHNQRG
jgi:hypothetical protein